MGNPDYSIVEGRGSSIDPEASGPFPPNKDERQRDVFLDQDDRINGPRSEAEPITDDFVQPQAFDISPPPPMPTLDFDGPVDLGEMAAEAARTAINDALRNMTINGVSPDISGGSVSFDIPTEPSASTAFAAMNAEPAFTPPLPETPAIVETPPMEPPPLPEAPEAPTPTPPSVPPPEDSASESAPEVSAPEGGGASPSGSTAPAGGDAPATPTPEAPATEPPPPAAPEVEAEVNVPEVGGGGGGGKDGFNPSSYARQKGEMRGEYEARMKNLERVMRDEDAAKAIGAGDMSYLNSGYLNVKFTRADGLREILVQVDNANSAVVMGAVGGERTTTLPADNGYYIAGGGGGHPHPWQIIIENRSNDPDNPQYQYKIESASRLYKGLDSWASVSVSGLGTWKPVSEGYVVLKGNVSKGVCQDASIEVNKSLPERIEFSEEDQTKFAAQLGYLYQEKQSWKIRQNAFHNFTVTDTCVGGKLAIYPIPT